MNPLFPKIPWRLLPRMLAMAVAGAAVSGVYGIFHDQITYTISPEYFTRLKFDQFRAADFGFAERVFVGEIGFLATWWVGFFGGWFLARIAVPAWPPREAWRQVGKGYLVMCGVALLSGIVGWGLGFLQQGNGPRWVEMCADLGVEDVRAFTHVGYIHNAGYLGGLLGLILAVAVVLRNRREARRVET